MKLKLLWHWSNFSKIFGIKGSHQNFYGREFTPTGTGRWRGRVDQMGSSPSWRLPSVFHFVSILTSVILQVRLNYVMQRAICGSIFHLFLPLMQMVCATMPCRNSEMVQTRSNLMHGCRTVMNRQYSQDTAYKCMLTHLQKLLLKAFETTM